MPIHSDWKDMYNNIVKQYGLKKGKQVFYSYMNKHGYDETKPRPGKKKEEMTTSIKENVPITYMVPVQWETIKEGKINEAYVKGIAISATTSRNNVSYIVEELEKSYSSLNGKNIAVGHDEDPSNNVGLIENVNWDGNNVNYFAKIYNTYKHPDAVEMVKKKLWQYVSIEAIVSKLIKEEDKFIAQGINFTGLSFVRTPGVENATANFSADESFAQAIAEGYTLKTKTEEKIMAEEKIKEELEEDPAEEETEEKVDTSKLIAEGVKKELEKIQEAERVKKLEEENKKLKVQLEEKAKSEAVVSDSIVKEPETNLIFEKYGGETSFWVMPESDGKIRRAS